MLLLLVLLGTLLYLPAYEDRAFACEFTCSHMGYREWLFGFRTGDWYSKSPIEKKLDGDLKHQWVSYAGTERNIFGSVLSRGHRSPHRAAVSRGYWPYFASLSKEEARALYTTFQTTDRDALERFIDALEQRVDEFYRSQPVGSSE